MLALRYNKLLFIFYCAVVTNDPAATSVVVSTNETRKLRENNYYCRADTPFEWLTTCALFIILIIIIIKSSIRSVSLWRMLWPAKPSREQRALLFYYILSFQKVVFVFETTRNGADISKLLHFLNSFFLPSSRTKSVDWRTIKIRAHDTRRTFPVNVFFKFRKRNTEESVLSLKL